MPDRSVTYTFRGNFSNLSAGLVTAGRNVTELGGKLTALDARGAKMRSGLADVGKVAGGIGLVAAAGVAVAIRAAANFEQAMSNVQAATHETSANMGLLRDAAIKAGQATQYSASEAAGAIEELAKAGVSTKDILAGGLAGALNLAAAGSINVADAAEIAASALVQFKLSGDQVPHVADLLAAGAGKAQGSVEDLGYALKYAGVPAASLGLSIEDTTGVLAEFASAGIVGEQAGTTLRAMLVSLAAPTKAAQKTMNEYGISLYDAQGRFIGIEAAATELHDKLGPLNEAQRNQALNQLFTNSALQGAIKLYEGGGQAVQDWTNKVNDTGYAADTAKIKMNNLRGDLEQLRGSLETALIGAGGGSQGPLRELVQGATEAVNVFNKLPGPVQNSVVALAGLTAVVGGGLWFTSKVVNGVTSMQKALENLGVSAGTSSRALRGVAIAGATLATLEIAGHAINALNDTTRETLPGVQELTKQLLGLSAAGTGAGLDKQFDDLGNSIRRITDKSFQESFNDTASGISNVATSIIGLHTQAGSLSDAKDEISALDEALANIATTGSADQARQAFASLASSQGLSKEQTDALVKLMPQYRDALAGSANQATLAAGATGDFASATSDAGQSAEDAAQQIQDSIKAMEDQRSAAISAFDAVTGYRQAMKDATKQAKDSDAGIKGNSDAALKNRDALSKLASAWNSQSHTITDNVAKLKEAKANFITTATAMKVPEAEAKRLANQLFEIPSNKVTSFSTPGLPEAAQKAQTLSQILASLHNKDIYVALHYQTIGNRGPTGGAPLPGVPNADGGSVPKTGMGYADRHPYLLADGEEVVSNRYGQADRNRSLLKAINANRLADGGTAGRFNQTFTLGDGSPVGHAAHEAADGLRHLKHELAASEKALDREKQKRDDLTSKMSDLASSVSTGLRSDIFTSSTSPWASGLGAVAYANSTLSGDVTSGRMFASLVKSLKGRGLHGAALQSLIEKAAQDNNVGLLQQFANASGADLATYQANYDLRDRVLAGTGTYTASAVYGAQAKVEGKRYEELRDEVRKLRQEVKRADKGNRDGLKQNSADTAHNMNWTAGNAHRRGKRGPR